MCILVVGGDRLGSINRNLENYGFTKIKHLSGRKQKDIRSNVPSNMDAVLILTDYVGHNLCKKIKEEAKDLGIKTYFSKRSWASIRKTLNFCQLPQTGRNSFTEIKKRTAG